MATRLIKEEQDLKNLSSQATTLEKELEDSISRNIVLPDGFALNPEVDYECCVTIEVIMKEKSFLPHCSVTLHRDTHEVSMFFYHTPDFKKPEVGSKLYCPVVDVVTSSIEKYLKANTDAILKTHELMCSVRKEIKGILDYEEPDDYLH
ncbi:MAG: hypothetical protein GW898_10555 [Thiomicrospira sp.]|nr:hypothetical protein [Thiomicrospira sp.]NCN66343.1 hypothetical protein [Thiomicrospira sp.]NCO14797.1 hypothetical protein [Thiomicrospira sp.]NCO82393.1 hypothetical protein [Thiomicrospira sp.]OIP95478.1 MAG: hypothetical protein AUK56_05405 [Thiomicrospira sp. CG2_30_44_34]